MSSTSCRGRCARRSQDLTKKVMSPHRLRTQTMNRFLLLLFSAPLLIWLPSCRYMASTRRLTPCPHPTAIYAKYANRRLTGLGQADYTGWGLFIDEGGEDQYRVASGFGDSSEKSVAGFFDLEGNDIYTLPPTSSTPADTRPTDDRRMFYPQGGAFVDR